MTVIEARNVSKSFVVQRNLVGQATKRFHAVKGVNLSVARGETLGLVGESGAGKSTVGRLVLRLIEPDEGTIRFGDVDMLSLRPRQLRALRAKARMIFQDPYSSFDSTMVVGDSVGEPLAVHEHLKGQVKRQRVTQLFERVGLGAHQLDRYPYEFSGGQLQRIAVARAIATNPDLVVCDEPVASLDMSIRAQVINLLRELQDERGMAYVFISHDLSLVGHIAHRVAVMYGGRIVEVGETGDVFKEPRHPYTQSLLAAIPVADPSRRHRQLAVEAPAGDADQQRLNGCDYSDRCPHAMDICSRIRPELRSAGRGRVACHLYPGGAELSDVAPRAEPAVPDSRP
jgi:oligopeptide/dipeptide ABC transporter ATP-binding protein